MGSYLWGLYHSARVCHQHYIIYQRVHGQNKAWWSSLVQPPADELLTRGCPAAIKLPAVTPATVLRGRSCYGTCDLEVRHKHI